MADGINTILAAGVGTFPNTTFSQNNGVIQVTGVASRHVGYLIALGLVLLGAIPALREAGGFHRADLVRVVGAIAIPITGMFALTESQAPALPILAVFAGELAVGGLDNLLSRHQAAASPASVSLRTLGSSAAMLACVLVSDHAPIFAWAAMAISALGVAHEFWHGRSHYLDDKKRDEELRHS